MFSKAQINELAPKLEKLKQDKLIKRYTYLGLLSEYQLYVVEPKQQLI